jgi:transglutaminase-like putative cysteine protease
MKDGIRSLGNQHASPKPPDDTQVKAVYWVDATVIDELWLKELTTVKEEYNDSVSMYLKSGKYVDSQNPDIVRKAEELIAGSRDETTKMKILFEFVRDSVDEGDFDGYRASEVLRSRNGFCYNKSILLIALCRAAGITCETWL